MKYSSDKDINKLVRSLIRQGWIYCRGRKHGQLKYFPYAIRLIVPCTPSDSHAYQNFRRDVKKAINAFC